MWTKALFLPSLGLNALMTKIGNRRWYDRIDETVLLGALPIRSIARKLIDNENVRAMISVTEDFELRHMVFSLEELKFMGIERLQLRTTDYIGSPTQEQILQAMDFIQSHQRQNHCVYIHCKAGRTRSATVAICYVMQHNQWTPQKAIEFIKAKRPHIMLRDKQLASINSFYESYQKTH
ncbi:unnamed protein product [Candidula unifasciata]|uniref:Phosphatidylglycerophosphatase and protein-tyrosine phosphatase 1 n=1 Tax=Candidula unifasciata TaxID=100452 RepID=A0A8S3ZQL0_9EUPU|nr:unnamed protein product [Candidula unifasciata]